MSEKQNSNPNLQMHTNTTNKNKRIVYPKLSYLICGLCFKVQPKLGCYRNEKQYADMLEELFRENNIKYIREGALLKSFKAERPRRNIPDFIIEDKIILDLKAKTAVEKEDYFQVKRYLVSSGKRLGIIVNFRRKHLAPKRILNPTYKRSA